MKDMIFKDSKVQKGHRVKIPKAIVDTLSLEEGREIEIKFNLEKNQITIDL